jgi:hypothetical protein
MITLSMATLGRFLLFILLTIFITNAHAEQAT